VSRLRIVVCGVRSGATALFIVLLASCIFAAPLAVEAQQAGKIPSIGYLSPRPGPSFTTRPSSKGCATLATSKARTSPSNTDGELGIGPTRRVCRRVGSPQGGRDCLNGRKRSSACGETCDDGDSNCLCHRRSCWDRTCSSLSRPGGNLTGVNILTTELNAKRLDLLKEAFPGASRIGVLANPGPRRTGSLGETWRRSPDPECAAIPQEVRGPNDLDNAFAAMVKERVDALLVLNDPLLFAQRGRIAGLAAKNKLPGIYEWREFSGAEGS